MVQSTEQTEAIQKKTLARLQAQETEAKALALRKAGYTYEAIARRLHYKTHSAAVKAVQRGLASITKAPAQALIDLETARLDELLTSVWTDGRNGDLKAVDRALRVIDQRCKLLGLYPRQPAGGVSFTATLLEVRATD